MSNKNRFIVVYDDGQGLCVPYAFNPDVAGAVQAAGEREDIACFDTSADARRAVRISVAAARLAKEQGEIANDDFIGKSLKNVRVRRLARKS